MELDGALPHTPGFIALVPVPNRGTSKGYPGRFGAGPWIGARVASQRGPVFRPGRGKDNRIFKVLPWRRTIEETKTDDPNVFDGESSTPAMRPKDPRF
jgi:hypothetical protein